MPGGTNHCNPAPPGSNRKSSKQAFLPQRQTGPEVIINRTSMLPQSESELIARCRRGEPAAWDELFDRHYAATARFIFQLSRELTKEDAEEICQEVFLNVIKNLDSFQGGCQFQTWVFRIAANKTGDFRERRQAAKRGGDARPFLCKRRTRTRAWPSSPPSQAPAPRPRPGFGRAGRPGPSCLGGRGPALPGDPRFTVLWRFKL
jgi:hypothetical protein